MIKPIRVFLDNAVLTMTGKREVPINQLGGDFYGMKTE